MCVRRMFTVFALQTGLTIGYERFVIRVRTFPYFACVCVKSSREREYLHPGQVDSRGGGARESLPGIGVPPGVARGIWLTSTGYAYCG